MTALLLAALFVGIVLGALARPRVDVLFAPHGGRHTAAAIAARATHPMPVEATS